MDPTDLLTVANGATKVVLQGEQFPGMEGIHVQVHLVLSLVARKPVFGVSDKARLKPVSSATKIS